MKITKIPNDILLYRIKEQQAKLDCDICPCCGEYRNISDVVMTKNMRNGLFSTQRKTVTIYECNRCGSQWESDPY